MKSKKISQSGNNTVMKEIRDWVISILIAIALAIFIRHYIVELYVVEGPSMLPTLESSERLVVSKFSYRFKEPEKGEILVFRYPRDPRRDFIKRVIAVPGDNVSITDGRVFVNDKELEEDYILEPSHSFRPAAIVPEGHYYVMGDNRNNSEDSRSSAVGFVPLNLIKGKAVAVFWPLTHIKTLP